MNVYITTNGCPENRIDCAGLEVLLSRMGWTISNNVGASDLIIFNACGLTQKAEAEGLDIIHAMRQKMKKESKLVITGCLVRINPDLLNSFHQNRNIEIDDLDTLWKKFHGQNSSNGIYANYLVDQKSTPWSFLNRNALKDLLSLDMYSSLSRLYLFKKRQSANAVNIINPNTFYIKICSGCVNSCSYCAVKLSRGAVKSKSIARIKQELLGGLQAGFREFALIGTDLGSYGRDIQTDLIALLETLNAIDAAFHIKLRNVHPRLYIQNLQAFLEVLKPGKIKYMDSAVQSGSNRVLRDMNRGYNIEDFIFSIQAIKSAVPDMLFRSQVIAGFPGETETEFQQTLQLLKSVHFDFVEVYKYSPRSGTLAMAMPDQVSRRKLNRRAFALGVVAA